METRDRAQLQTLLHSHGASVYPFWYLRLAPTVIGKGFRRMNKHRRYFPYLLDKDKPEQLTDNGIFFCLAVPSRHHP